MNTPRAILIGFAMIATAVYLSKDVGPAQAASGTPKFQISAVQNAAYFKIRVDTGKVAFCVVKTGTTSRDQIKKAKISCSNFQ